MFHRVNQVLRDPGVLQGKLATKEPRYFGDFVVWKLKNWIFIGFKVDVVKKINIFRLLFLTSRVIMDFQDQEAHQELLENQAEM